MGILYNRFTPKTVVPVRYGISITTEATPTITYLYDAVGFTPASMNFSTGVFNWGSWANTPLMRSIYPIVTSNSSSTTAIGYKLDPNDLTKKYDGTPIDSPLTGNAATVFEGGWLHTEVDTNSNPNKYIIVWSNVQWDNTYYAYHRMNHNNSNGTVYSSFALGIYCDTGLGTKSAVNWFQYNYIISLLRIIGKTTHVLDTFGTGYTGAFTKGIGDTAGAFYGFNKTSTASTDYSKIFYLEQFFAKSNALKGLRGKKRTTGNLFTLEYYYNGNWVSSTISDAYTQYVNGGPNSSQYPMYAYNRINGYHYDSTYGFVPYYYGNALAYNQNLKGVDWPLWDFEAGMPVKLAGSSIPSYVYLQSMTKSITHLSQGHSTSNTELSSGKRTVQFIS